METLRLRYWHVYLERCVGRLRSEAGILLLTMYVLSNFRIENFVAHKFPPSENFEIKMTVLHSVREFLF